MSYSRCLYNDHSSNAPRPWTSAVRTALCQAAHKIGCVPLSFFTPPQPSLPSLERPRVLAMSKVDEFNVKQDMGYGRPEQGPSEALVSCEG